MIYFDHAASTTLLPDVLETLRESYYKDFANPSSSHHLGRIQKDGIEKTRQEFLSFIKANEGKLIFLSSATEANNLAINSMKLKPGMKVLVLPSDHLSLREPLVNRNVDLIYFPLNQGKEGIEDWLDNQCPHVDAVVISMIHGLTGQLLPIDKIVKAVRKKSKLSLVLVDASQGFGKLKVDISQWGADFVSVSAHKSGGPKGIACLYAKHDLVPMLLGGGQEYQFRSSTPVWPLINAWSKALPYWEFQRDKFHEKSKELKTIIEEETKPEIFIPIEGVDYLFPLIVPQIQGDILARYLDSDHIYVSTSNACSSTHSKTISPYRDLGIDPHYEHNVLRISFGATSNSLEAKTFARVISFHYENLKKIIGKR